MHGFFTTFIYQPLYNGLIFLTGLIPHADAGVALILFTALVKLILFPLSQKSIKTQLHMKETEQELAALKEKYKSDKQVQTRAILAFYKEKNISPFLGVALAFVQLPIIIALYQIFLLGGLPKIDTSLLYSFVAAPSVSMNFLGFLDITQKSFFLAALAGVAQYIQACYSMPLPPKKNPAGGKPSFGDDLARSMGVQMKYFLPLLVAWIAYTYSGVVALYLITSSVFQIGQEVYVRRRMVRSETISNF